MLSKLVLCKKCQNIQEFIDIEQNALISTHADLIEFRADNIVFEELSEQKITSIMVSISKPLIFTCRSKSQGGLNDFSQEQREFLYQTAFQLKFPYIDIEYSDLSRYLPLIHSSKNQSQIIMSYHDYNGISLIEIIRFIHEMAEFPQFILKIVSFISSDDEVIQFERLQKEIYKKYSNISLFGMGPFSHRSRIFGFYHGNVLTYVAADKQTKTAPNQLNLEHFLFLNEINSISDNQKNDDLGRKLHLSLFGGSHTDYIGIRIQNIPPNIKLNLKKIQMELDRRKPGMTDISSSRKEADQFIIHSGVEGNITTGDEMIISIKNIDTNSVDYSKFKTIPRPSHVDYPAMLRYGKEVDLRGSGRFSGRMTAPIVAAGAIAKQILIKKEIKIASYVYQVGNIVDSASYTCNQIIKSVVLNNVNTVDTKIAKKMEDLISQVKNEGDSIGGVVSVRVENFLAGIGDPWFHSLESDLASAIMAIPGVRGIEFGSGFQAVAMKGSEHNDRYILKDNKISTESNHSGGIIGGISIGTPLIFRVAIKPTASIKKPQATLNLATKKIETLQIEGRHDPCIAPRISVVIESISALVLLDMLMVSKKI